MADEIKKTTDEVKENIENTQEGAISDDAAEDVVGGIRYPTLTDTERIKAGYYNTHRPQTRE